MHTPRADPCVRARNCAQYLYDSRFFGRGVEEDQGEE